MSKLRLWKKKKKKLTPEQLELLTNEVLYITQKLWWEGGIISKETVEKLGLNRGHDNELPTSIGFVKWKDYYLSMIEIDSARKSVDED